MAMGSILPGGVNAQLLITLPAELDQLQTYFLELQEMVGDQIQKDSKFPANKLTIPGMKNNIETDGISYKKKLYKADIASHFGEQIQICIDKGHSIHYIQRHEDGKDGCKLFFRTKVICGTCLSQFIQLLYTVAINIMTNPLENSVGIPVPVPVPLVEQKLPILTIPDEANHIFDCQHLYFERAIEGNFGPAKFREYTHLPTNRPVFIKVVENKNPEQLKSIIETERNVRIGLNQCNTNEFAIFYGLGFNQLENAYWLAMESMGISLYELDLYYDSKNQPQPEELFVGIANVVLNTLSEGYYMYLPQFELTFSSFFLNWEGQLKICDFPELKPDDVNSINRIAKIDDRIKMYFNNVDIWRKAMLKKLSTLLLKLLHNKPGPKHLMDFIKDCRKESLPSIKNTKFCKIHNLPNKTLLFDQLYSDIVKSNWYLQKEILNKLQYVKEIQIQDTKQIVKNCDQLFLLFFNLYTENNEIEHKEILEIKISEFVEDKQFQEKMLIFLDNLKMNIGFANDDEFTKLDICQKSSGVTFWKNLVKNLESFKTVHEKLIEIDEVLKIWKQNFPLIDQECIPDMITDVYNEEHWWWFRRRQKMTNNMT